MSAREASAQKEALSDAEKVKKTFNPYRLRPVKRISNKDLGVMYGVDPRTVKSWLEPFKKFIGKKIGNFYNPRQVKRILQSLGEPFVISPVYFDMD